jgi:hypothetical protein
MSGIRGVLAMEDDVIYRPFVRPVDATYDRESAELFTSLFISS